jgi:hypothetical protein
MTIHTLNIEEGKSDVNNIRTSSTDFRTWKYVTQIEVEEHSGNELIGFPIRIIINTEELISQNKLEPDCKDLRFATFSGQILNYWIESGINSNVTIIWIKIPLLNGNNITVINMYYGNLNVESKSDGTGVFDFYDSFEDENLNDYRVEVVGDVPYSISDHDSYSGDFTLTIGPSSCISYCWEDFQVGFKVETIDLPLNLYEISYWRREPQNNGGETIFFINNDQRYRINGPPTSEDTGWERNAFAFHGIIRDFELVESDVTTDQKTTIDNIIIRRAVLPIPSFFISSEISNIDTDNDGLPDWYELKNGLNLTENDSLEDLDNDGISNIDEYETGLNPLIDDTNDDLDGDGMPNLWEIQNGLNISFNDANYDKDGDWVTNYREFREDSNPSDFWSVPLIYEEFPFICLSVLHFSFLGIITLISSSGTYSFFTYSRKKLTKQLGAPDYKTAQLMIKGGFQDFVTFNKAQNMGVSSLEEYDFTLEMMDLEKEEK